MQRRAFLTLIPASLSTFVFAAGTDSVLTGRLIRNKDGKPALQTTDGRTVKLSGDADTESVLNDDRIIGSQFEVIGRQDGDRFIINPIHTAAFFAIKDGKRLRVTYWCDVCAIRTYTPGLCMCCREETVVDLRDPDTVDKK